MAQARISRSIGLTSAYRGASGEVKYVGKPDGADASAHHYSTHLPVVQGSTRRLTNGTIALRTRKQQPAAEARPVGKTSSSATIPGAR
jgi:hypothetical protein